jgi:hypothetical protein
MNGLHARGVINRNTKLIPKSYDTFIQLVDTDATFYGYHIATPKHDWPYYSEDTNSWAQLQVTNVSDTQKVGHFDFQAGPVEPKVDTTLEFTIPDGKTANAIRLSGAAQLTDSITLGACNSFSGDKILHLNKVCKGTVRLRVKYTMGAGLDNLEIVFLD